MNELEEYKQMGFDSDQMRQISWGMAAGLDVSIYANLQYNCEQMEQLRKGLEDGLDVSVYANPEYNWEQMNEIRKGLEGGLDVSAYANPEYSWMRMAEIRRGLEDGTECVKRKEERAEERHEPERRYMENEKVPPIKAKPVTEDLIDLLEVLTPSDITRLYFTVVGILQARGYKLIN